MTTTTPIDFTALACTAYAEHLTLRDLAIIELSDRDDVADSTMVAIAGALGISSAGLTGLVDKLEALGMVRRTRTRDRRLTIIVPTEHGKRALRRAHAAASGKEVAA